MQTDEVPPERADSEQNLHLVRPAELHDIVVLRFPLERVFVIEISRQSVVIGYRVGRYIHGMVSPDHLPDALPDLARTLKRIAENPKGPEDLVWGKLTYVGFVPDLDLVAG